MKATDKHTFLQFEVNGEIYSLEQMQTLYFADNPTVVIWYIQASGMRTKIVENKYRELFGS